MADPGIDIVYTWVDGQDPKWQAKKHKALGEAHTPVQSGASDDARFVQFDELRYSLRSVHQYAPWARRIFLVTDQQVPPWLDPESSRIAVVDHTDIFGPQAVLPTFNSMAIGLQLYKIPELAEHFLYFNDDVFLGYKAKPKWFFPREGVAHAFVGRQTKSASFEQLCLAEHLPESARNEYQRAMGRIRAKVHDKTGQQINIHLRHGVKCLLRSYCAELAEEFSDDFLRTSQHQFRTGEDVLISGLHEIFGLAQGRVLPKYVTAISRAKTHYHLYPHHKRYMHFRIAENFEKAPLEWLDRYQPFMFCINSSSGMQKAAIEQMQNYLKKRFCEPAPWEIA